MFKSIFGNKDARQKIIAAKITFDKFDRDLESMRFIGEDRHVKVVMDGKFAIKSIEVTDHQSLPKKVMEKHLVNVIASTKKKAEASVAKFTRTSGIRQHIAGINVK